MRALLLVSAAIDLFFGVSLIGGGLVLFFSGPKPDAALLNGLFAVATLGMGLLVCRHGWNYFRRPTFETARNAFLLATIGVALALSSLLHLPPHDATNAIRLVLCVAVPWVLYRFVVRAAIQRLHPPRPG